MKALKYIVLLVLFGCGESNQGVVDQSDVRPSSKDQLKEEKDTMKQEPIVFGYANDPKLADFLFDALPDSYENQTHLFAENLGVSDSMIDFASAHVPIKLNFNGDEFDDYLLVQEEGMYFAEGLLVNGKTGEKFPVTSSFKTFDPEIYGDQPMHWHRGLNSTFKVVDVDPSDGLEDLAVMYRRTAVGDEANIFQIFSLNKEHHYCDLIFEYEVSSAQYTVDLDTDEIGNLTEKEFYVDVLSTEVTDMDTINIYSTTAHEYMDEFPGISWKNHDPKKRKTFVYDKVDRVYKQL